MIVNRVSTFVTSKSTKWGEFLLRVCKNCVSSREMNNKYNKNQLLFVNISNIPKFLLLKVVSELLLSSKAMPTSCKIPINLALTKQNSRFKRSNQEVIDFSSSRWFNTEEKCFKTWIFITFWSLLKQKELNFCKFECPMRSNTLIISPLKLKLTNLMFQIITEQFHWYLIFIMCTYFLDPIWFTSTKLKSIPSIITALSQCNSSWYLWTIFWKNTEN